MKTMKTTYKVIVAGSRGITQYELVAHWLDRILANKLISHDVVIVCGMCRGPDMHGYRYAKERNLSKPIEMPADWDNINQVPNHNRRVAGHVRNAEMGKVADAAIVFVLDDSSGSSGMVSIMKRLKKLVTVLTIKTKETDYIEVVDVVNYK